MHQQHLVRPQEPPDRDGLQGRSLSLTIIGFKQAAARQRNPEILEQVRLLGSFRFL